MGPLDKLLEDVSPAKPCGEDLEVRNSGKDKEDSGDLNHLEELLERIKPSAGDEKDWKSIVTAASERLGQSKDLRLALILNLGLLKTSQLAGFRDGLAFLRALVEKHWDNLYPALRDGNPTRRVNALNSLSLPAHRKDAAFDFVRTLRQVPLARPPKGAPVSLNDVRASEKPVPKEEGKPPAPTATAVKAAFESTDAAALGKTLELLTSITGDLEALREFLAEKGASPDLSNLRETLNEMIEELEQYVKPQVKEAMVAEGPEENGARVQPQAHRNGSRGPIQSLDDVVLALGEICKYYEVSDRSSPVPLLLKRVQRLAKMNFYEIMEDLTPEEIAKLKSVPKG
jgi:type VI secretion system protein ImpA